jgi:hypothetical protein
VENTYHILRVILFRETSEKWTDWWQTLAHKQNDGELKYPGGTIRLGRTESPAANVQEEEYWLDGLWRTSPHTPTDHGP